MPPKPRRTARLVAAEMIAPGVRSLVLELEGDEPLGQTAGQWVNLYLSTPAGELKRAYSIASPPFADAPRRFEVAVTLVEGGPGSTALHALPIGGLVPVEGPWGVFTLARAEATMPIVFVGTGTGVTPLRAMLRAEFAGGAFPAPRVLLFGSRTPPDLLYAEELRALEAQATTFRYVPTLSRAQDGWTGRRGYVQHHLREILAELGPAHVFVCGLTKMVQEVRALLKDELGFERKLIHTERYD